MAVQGLARVGDRAVAQASAAPGFTLEQPQRADLVQQDGGQT